MSSSGAPMPPTLPATSRGVLGMPLVAKSNFSTGSLTHTSYLICSDDLSFVFSTPYSTSIATIELLEPNSTSFVPTFDHESCLAFVASHGLAIRAIVVEVKNAETAFHTSIAHGTKPSASLVLLNDKVILTDILLYSDIVLRYISYNKPYRVSDPNPNNWILPKFELVEELSSYSLLDYEIRRLDHAVSSTPELALALNYEKAFTGFHKFAKFTAKDMGTSESGLNSMLRKKNGQWEMMRWNISCQIGEPRGTFNQTY